MSMYSTRGFFLFLLVALATVVAGPTATRAATGDVTAVRVINNTCTAGATCNGWVAEIDIEGLSTGGTYNMGIPAGEAASHDPTNAKIVFSVRSPGFDANGDPTFVTRTIYGTKQIRQPYPNQAVTDETVSGGTVTVRVALSDFVYVGDDQITVTIGSGFYTQGGVPNNAATGLSVTNQSVLAYQKPVTNWTIIGRTLATSTLTLSMFGMSGTAAEGKPLAAVRFNVTDASGNSATSTVSSMTQRTGPNGVSFYHYSHTFDITGLTHGQTITANYLAYPRIGDANAVFNTNSNAALGEATDKPAPLFFVNDKNNTYGRTFAFAAATGGDDSTCVASATLATASSSPCRTIARAMRVARDLNNTSLSRGNLANSIIYLREGTYSGTGTAYNTSAYTSAGDTAVWTLTKAPEANRANVILQTSATSTNRLLIGNYVVIRDVTIRRDANQTLFRANNTTSNRTFTVMDSVIEDSQAYTTGFYLNFNRTAIINSTISNASSYGGTFVIGNTFTDVTRMGTARFHAGNLVTNGGLGQAGAIITESTDCSAGSDGSIIYNNRYINLRDQLLSIASNCNWSNGFVFANNLVESVETTGNGPVIAISADGTETSTNNMLFVHNTIAGNRANLGYNDSGSSTTPQTNWTIKYNVFDYFANKGDTFGPNNEVGNALRTGNWPINWGVANAGNFASRGQFLQTFPGIYSTYGTNDNPLSEGYVDDETAGSGNGDYRLQQSSLAVGRIIPNTELLNFDLEGVERQSNSARAAGALEGLETPSDITPPSISSVASSTTSSTATITWTTNEAANSYVEYGTTLSYGSSTVSATLTTSHSLVITGLAASTTYNFRVRSTDANGNTSTSTNYTFTTTAAADVTPPTVAVTAPADGSTVSGEISVTASAADTGGIAGVRFFANSTAIGLEDTNSPYSVLWDTTGVADGSYTLTAVARDAAGNIATSTGVSVTVANTDTTPPVISGVASSTTSTSATITWTTDESADSYVQYGTTLSYGSATTSATLRTSHSMLITGLTSSTTYNFRVRSTDANGNTSTSTNYTFTTAAAPDVTPPSISITAPADGATVDGEVTVSASATDTGGIAGVQFLLDGSPLGVEDTTSTYSTVWDTIAGVDGTYTLRAVARDTSGNYATSSAVTVTVQNAGPADTTPPSISNIASSTTGTAATITWSTNEPGTSYVEYGVTLTYGTAFTSGTLTTTHNVLLTGLTGSTTYNFRVRSTDAAGNTSTSTNYTFTTSSTADVTPPTVTIASPASSATVAGTVVVTATASDTEGVAGVRFLANGIAIGSEDTGSPYEVSWDTTGLANGSFTLLAVARDTSGNVATSSSVTVTVQNSQSGDGGGGGGGGGSSGSSGQSSSATAIPATPSPGTTQVGVGGTSTLPFAQFSIGTTGTPVRTLQLWLIANGFSIPAGATGYFGPQTQSALAAYRLQAAQAQLGAPTAGSPFTRFLTIGSTGTDVVALQQILRTRGFYRFPEITGYFGPVTRQAVVEFQRSMGIQPLGIVGPATRAALNAIPR